MPLGATEDFLVMLEVLKIHDIYATNQFFNDICKLVKTDKIKFIHDFQRDMIRVDKTKHNRYERLSLTSNQSQKLKGKSMYRYEYRNTSNLRCIYIIEDEHNRIILLKAFNEDKTKTKGKGNYDINIERAIRIYTSLKNNDNM